MSLKKEYIYWVLLLLFSCTEKPNDKFFNYSKPQRDSIANNYNEIANYFLQPSEKYRIYKDSANLAQPNNVDYWQTLSYSYKKRGEHIKAMKTLNKAVSIDTANGSVEALGYKAWSLLYYYRDYKGVIKDVNLIRKISKRSYSSCWGEPCGFLKGQALYKLNRFKEAIKTFHEVNVEEEKLGFDITSNTLLFFYVGRCYAEMGMNEKAIEYYNKTLSGTNYKFPEAYYQLGLVYKKMNKFEDAKLNLSWAQKYIHYKMGEPYIERFDELFPYMIQQELDSL